MKILVINAGSSSVKYQLIDMLNDTVLAKGQCDRIGIAGGNFKHKVPGREDYKIDVDMKNHGEAVSLVVKTLASKEYGVINSMDEINAVGHRVLHGGEKFSGSVIVDDKVIAAIEECCELGPLHNPHNLTGIRAGQEIMPGTPQVAVFDTGFHQTMPDYAYLYALPYEYYEKYKIRRYGFHGTSHRYVSMRTAKFLNKDPKDLKIVTCHLGNGSSIAAVDGGKCLDTTMGVTPLEGIMMGTRCGSIDPAIVPLLMKKENLTPDQIDTIMNKKSGYLGLCGHSDSRDIEAGMNAGDADCKLTYEVQCYSVKKYIGAYMAVLGHVDCIAFAGGIGENAQGVREHILEGLEEFGIKIDPELNKIRNSQHRYISTEDSRVKVAVIPTDEELEICRISVAMVEEASK